MTNNELYKVIETENVISEEVVDILLELDTTNSVSTQIELNKLLVTLYNRLGTENGIVIHTKSENITTQAGLIKWIDDEIDQYSTDMFHKSIVR